MASFMYPVALDLVLSSTLNMETMTLKAMLLKDSHTPSKEHVNVGQLVADECDATNYTGGYGGAGRKTLANVAVTFSGSGGYVKLDSDDPSVWSGLGGAANNTLSAVAIIYETGGTDASSVPFFFTDFADRATDGTDFPVFFNSNGWERISL